MIIAKKHHIETNVQVIVPEYIPIEPIYLMSVFTNLLDNAIEACQSLKEDNRFIDIDSMVQSNYLIIKVKNSKPKNTIVDLNKTISSKDNPKEHGLGLQIIKKTCQKNHGNFKVKNHVDYIELYATLKIKKVH